MLTTILLWDAVYAGSTPRNWARWPEVIATSARAYFADVFQHAGVGRQDRGHPAKAPKKCRPAARHTRYLIVSRGPQDRVHRHIVHSLCDTVCLCGNYFGIPRRTTFAAYLLSLLLRLRSASTSRPASAWWASGCSVTSLLYIVPHPERISGHMFPIDLLPEPADLETAGSGTPAVPRPSFPWARSRAQPKAVASQPGPSA